MSSRPLPQWQSPTRPFYGRISRRWNGFSHAFNRIRGITISFSLVGLIFYMTFSLPHGPLLLSNSKWSAPTNHASSSPTSDEAPSLLPNILSLEQIRDIVAPTRGFFSRDYSLWLGWNNVSIQANLNLPVIRAALMAPNRSNIFSNQPSSKQICLIAPWLFLRLFTHVHASIICMFFFLFHADCGFITTRHREQ